MTQKNEKARQALHSVKIAFSLRLHIPPYTLGIPLQCILNILGGHDLLDGAFHIQPIGVVAGVGLVRHGMNLALDHELIVVQVAVICGNTEVVTHILAAQTLLTGHQGLEQLLAVTSADDVRRTGIAEQLLDSLSQIADGRGISLLDEQVAGIGVLKKRT